MPTLLSLPLLAGCLHFPAAPPIVAYAPDPLPSVLIQDVRVFSAGPAGLQEHMDVRLEGGLVAEVAPTGSLPAPSSPPDLVISGAGRTLLPGFIDLHVHLALIAGPPWFMSLPNPEHNARATVFSGVTTVLDVGGDPKVLTRLQHAISAGKWIGPRIEFAGPGLTVLGAYPLNMTQELYGPLAYSSVKDHHFVAVGSVAEIEAEVDRIAASGATFIKLMTSSLPPSDPPAPRLSEAEIVAATQRAHARGLRVAAHVDDTEDALRCARAGVDLLAHGVETSRLTAADLAELRASGIAVEPTLVNWQRFDSLLEGKFAPTLGEMATQPPALLASFSAEALRAHASVLTESSFKTWGDALTAHREERLTNVSAMYEAGIPILVGSDTQGSIATFPGALHEELKLLVAAGIPAEVVLHQATRGNALFLDTNANYGLVEAGRIADLVLVEGDPTQHIGATEHIVQVFVGGAPVR